jgi:PAS domain S-box-containing protein
MSAVRLLLIEDVEADSMLIARHLRNSTLAVELRWVQNGAELGQALEDGGWDLVLSDYKVADLDFLETLALLKTKLPGAPVIMVSGGIGEETAVELLKTGLADFVLKDRLFRLVPAIERSLREQAEKNRRRQAEAELAHTSQLMRSVLDGAADAIFVKDPQGRYLLCNTAAAKMIGRSADEVIGCDDGLLFPPDTARAMREGDRAVMASRRVQTWEEELQLFNGAQCVTLVTKGPVFDAQGRISGVFGVSRDVTRLKHAETQLKIQEQEYRRLSQEYRTLLDNLPDGIIHLSPELQILWANAAAHQMFNDGVARLEPGRHCHAALWDQAKPCALCPATRCVASRQSEIGCLAPVGVDRQFEIGAVPVFNKSGDLEGVIEIIRDVTAHHKLEEQFRQAQKMESIGTLAGGIAHDFNNILSAVLGYGEMALEDLDQEHPAYNSVRSVIEAGMRASHLTKDLLLFSRKQISRKETVNVNTILSRVEKFIRRIIGEDIQCVTHLSPAPLPVFADSHQLDQVLMNFATNARDAMPGGGLLTLTTTRVEQDDTFAAAHGLPHPGPYALISVADTGRGMDRETAGKIFEPFFTTKEMGKGTGLGLAVVYGIIKDHLGHVEVASEPGKGSTFTVRLPLAEAAPSRRREQREWDHLRGGTETILLAEDEATVRHLLSSILEKKGYTVIKAVNGEDAVQKFREHRNNVALLLFDLIMPKMTGKAAMDAIHAICPETPGIFISGYAPENMQQKDLLDARAEMLFKPVSPKEMLATVRKILDAGGPGASLPAPRPEAKR